MSKDRIQALEARARQIAADKMGLIKDPAGSRLPEDLWWQAIPQAEAEFAAGNPDNPGLLRAVAIAQTVPGYETSEIYDKIFGAALKAGETL